MSKVHPSDSSSRYHCWGSKVYRS